MKNKEILSNGIFKENPVFIGFLGMCPTLATTGSISSALGMGLATTIVLLLANVIISLVKNATPSEIRIPVYIVIIASLVTALQMMLQAFVPSIYDSLGVFLALIVVNCIVLGRAEAFASKNSVVKSAVDGLGAGIGFTLALVIIGTFREVLGTGRIHFASYLDTSVDWINVTIFDEKYAWGLLSQGAGAFLTLGLVAGIITTIVLMKQKKAAAVAEVMGGIK